MAATFVIPVINMDINQINAKIDEKLEDPRMQRKVILVIVSIALLLDNMLYMVIVPIIPDYLRAIGAWKTHQEGADPEIITDPLDPNYNGTTLAPLKRYMGITIHEGEGEALGFLFASKAIVQLMVNPFSGAIIDTMGYERPMIIGLGIMFISTTVFACGETYTILFLARALQGVGSAFADTAGLAMIADRFTEENERTKALGIALAFISFGCLFAPPFGGVFYGLFGKQVPFLILALICLFDALMVLKVMKPQRARPVSTEKKLEGTPMWQLMTDPYIAVCAGTLTMANVSLAFLEPTISNWMEDNMEHTEEWQKGMIWLPAFFPHVFGVWLTVRLASLYPDYQWLMAAVGLAMEGLCCIMIPFTTNYWLLMLPICIICFGIALVDTALLPTLGYLVDTRYVSVYGSIYAIADISYNLAYAIGPIVAGGVVATIGFTFLNFLIAITNISYCPMLYFLRNIYKFKPFEENEANILMDDAPHPGYQTYMMQDQVNGPYNDQTQLNNDEKQQYGNSVNNTANPFNPFAGNETQFAKPEGQNGIRPQGGERHNFTPRPAGSVRFSDTDQGNEQDDWNLR